MRVRTAMVVASLTFGAARGVHAQFLPQPAVIPPAVLQNDALRVELIGLRRWTVPMIQDSLRRYAPQSSLLSHACAAALRTLGFADASAVYYAAGSGRGSGDGTRESVVVSVIEPQDSARVRYRAAFRDTLPAERAWAGAAALVAASPRAAQQSLRRPAFLLASTPPAASDSVLAPALPLRAFLRAYRDAAARARALQTLGTDGNAANRVAAVVLLANFADDDRAWWALVDGVRDPSTAVRVPAFQLLDGFTADRPRAVDWAPAAAGVRAVLDGTDLFAHNAMLAALTATHVDPALAPALLGGGGDLVLAKLRSSASKERALARALLVQLAGRDLGADADVWARWVATLSQGH